MRRSRRESRHSLRRQGRFTHSRRRLIRPSANLRRIDSAGAVIVGNKYESMSIAVQGAFDCDLTTIVDVWWECCELKTGIRRDQRVQVNHRSAVFPQESTGPAEVEVGYRD